MMLYQLIRSLATLNMAAHQGAAAFKRITKIIDKKIDIEENKSNPNLILKNSDISFKNVSFKYETTEEKAIKDINLNISGNTMNAFVGYSGAEKVQLSIYYQDFMIRKKVKLKLTAKILNLYL